MAGLPEVFRCTVVAQARIPLTRFEAFGEAALQTPPAGKLASSLTVMDVGTPGVSVLLIKSLRADRELSPSGVTGQAQHEINSSAGSNVYTLTQIRPAGSKPFNVPAFVRLTYESPLSRLASDRSW